MARGGRRDRCRIEPRPIEEIARFASHFAVLRLTVPEAPPRVKVVRTRLEKQKPPVDLIDHYRKGDDKGLDGYSERALARVWKAQRFSWWMTTLLHRFPDRLPYDDQLQQTEMSYLLSSETAMRLLAENYVGLPF